MQQISTLVPRLNPSLGFVTAQEIQNTTNNKKTEAKPWLGRVPAPSKNILYKFNQRKLVYENTKGKNMTVLMCIIYDYAHMTKYTGKSKVSNMKLK